ncbi:MAG: pectin methylesterase [Lachnospiraceae bacterium]|nr:pectin methylesterase [Lachnospiraceae bacterium]
MKPIHLYVNYPDKQESFPTIQAAIEHLSSDYSLPEAVYPAPTEDITPAIIHISPGIYREKLVLERPYVTLLGEAAENTILVFGDHASEIMEDGSKRGTFRTASFRIHTHDVCAKNLTFQNDSGWGYVVGQALALYVDGDRNSFYNCRLLGSQDTLFTAPLPMKEAQPGGFTGPGQDKPRTLGRQYYENCYIQGDVDFIFGGAIAYYNKCTLFSKRAEQMAPESLEDNIYGYITAASTFENEPYGYVFQDCKLESDCPKGSVFLGRPWREYAKTVFLNCELGEHIRPEGWNDWGKTHGHFFYAEYNSSGPGASPDTRADFSHQLSEEEASEYTVEKVLAGWIPECVTVNF